MQITDAYGSPLSKEAVLKEFNLPFDGGPTVERHVFKTAHDTRPDPAKVYARAENYALKRWLELARNPHRRVRKSDQTTTMQRFIAQWYSRNGLA